MSDIKNLRHKSEEIQKRRLVAQQQHMVYGRQ